MKWALPAVAAVSILNSSAQEANSGLQVDATLSGAAAYSHVLSANPRIGMPEAAAARLTVYPTVKINRNWSISAVFQAHSSPYSYQEYSSNGYSFDHNLMQLHLDYVRFWKNRSLNIRIGELPSAFGSFLLRYDDARNPLIDSPLTYGYYNKGVSLNGLAGAEIEGTIGKFDGRVQFANSSPANPRTILQANQYANWISGIGFTIRQGLRLGVSVYGGPYLDRTFSFLPRGNSNPRNYPATAYGLEGEWGHGHWNVLGELQRFRFPSPAGPGQDYKSGYIEMRRALHPRWYVATRVTHFSSKTARWWHMDELVADYRLNRHQLLKAGYEIYLGTGVSGTLGNAAVVQLVTSFTPLSWAAK